MTTQTPATAEIEKGLLIRSGFSQIFDSGPNLGPKEKCTILPESTPVIRIRSHLQMCKSQNLNIWLQNSQIGNPAFPAGARCQTKFLTSVKFLTCCCFSVILVLIIKK